MILNVLLQTDYEGQAKKLMELMEQTDMLIVAGGDGTVQEVITGLLRRPDQVCNPALPEFAKRCKDDNVIPMDVSAGENQQHTNRIHSTGLQQFVESKS